MATLDMASASRSRAWSRKSRPVQALRAVPAAPRQPACTCAAARAFGAVATRGVHGVGFMRVTRVWVTDLPGPRVRPRWSPAIAYPGGDPVGFAMGQPTAPRGLRRPAPERNWRSSACRCLARCRWPGQSAGRTNTGTGIKVAKGAVDGGAALNLVGLSNTVTRWRKTRCGHRHAAMPAPMMENWICGLPDGVMGAVGAAEAAGAGAGAGALVRRSRLAGRGSGLLMGGLSVTFGKRNAMQNQHQPLYTRCRPVRT